MCGETAGRCPGPCWGRCPQTPARGNDSPWTPHKKARTRVPFIIKTLSRFGTGFLQGFPKEGAEGRLAAWTLDVPPRSCDGFSRGSRHRESFPLAGVWGQRLQQGPGQRPGSIPTKQSPPVKIRLITQGYWKSGADCVTMNTVQNGGLCGCESGLRCCW